MIRSMLTIVLAGGFMCFATAAFASGPIKGNAAQGKFEVYSCHGCHGIQGYRNPYPSYHVPRIAGQNEQYIIDALNEYKLNAKSYPNGKRRFPTMNAQASSLTEQQIANIAAYLSSLAPKQLHTNNDSH